MRRLISLNDVTDCQLCTGVAPPFLWQLASVVADVISVCVKLLVAAGKWQNSGTVAFSGMEDVMPLLKRHYVCHNTKQLTFNTSNLPKKPITYAITLNTVAAGVFRGFNADQV
jgi:hypothetical protein